MWIKRSFQLVLESLSQQFSCLLLTGARQTGKSSLLKHLFPQANRISFDLPEVAAQAEENPEAFFKKNSTPLILDEVQYVPKLFRYLKHYIDENKKPGMYFLTGSQKFELMRALTESLAGRVAILDLEPLSFEEVFPVSSFSHPTPSVFHSQLLSFLLRGGYPELWVEPQLEFAPFYRSYMSTYLERDVRNLIQVKNLRDFNRFIRSCAIRSGTLLNKTDLSREVGVSQTTISEWLSVLEASGVLYFLEPWFTNRSKSIAKTPKLYFCDTGLLSFILNLQTPEDLESTPFCGQIFETFVCAQIRKHLELQGRKKSLFFFRDRDQEADFLIERGGRMHVFDAKFSQKPENLKIKRFEKTLASFDSGSLLSSGFILRSPSLTSLEGTSLKAYPPLGERLLSS